MQNSGEFDRDLEMAMHKLLCMQEKIALRSNSSLLPQEKDYLDATRKKRWEDNENILHIMARDTLSTSYDFINVAQLLITLHPSILDDTDNKGYTPLCSALSRDFKSKSIKKGFIHVDSLAFLIKKGADCTTVLKFPILKVKLNTIFNYQDTFFYSISVLLLRTCQGMAKLEGQNFTKFIFFLQKLYHVKTGKPASNIMEDMVRLNLEYHYIPKDGKKSIAISINILHFLCRLKHEQTEALDLLELLFGKFLETSVDVNARDGLGRTALHIAAIYGKLNICKQLLAHNNIDKVALDHMKQTHLHRATMSNSVEVVKLFIDNGYNVNAIDKYDCSVLHRAITRKNEEVIKLLVESGAKVDTKNYDDETPIECAKCYNLSENIINLLVQHSKKASNYKHQNSERRCASM